MKDLEYISALTNIDDEFVNEAATAAKTVSITNKRKIALLVAAVMMAVMLVACSALIARSEIFTDEIPSVTVNERLEVMKDQTIDKFFAHLRELMDDHGIAEEDVITKACQEYLSHGYYFDEMLVATKDKLIGRIITDAKNFTFDVELIGFFYNEKTEEFKTVSQTATSSGGKLEIVMDAEKGWICYGGFMPRSHPEEEIPRFNGIDVIKYGDKPSVKAMKFMEEWRDQNLETVLYSNKDDRSDFSVIDIDYHTPISSYLSNETTDRNERIEAVVNHYEIQSLLNGEGKTRYERKDLENNNFFEFGYAYDKDGFVIFSNSTDPEYIYSIHSAGIFYNADKDQYRITWRHASAKDGMVLKAESKRSWECIGVAVYTIVPDSQYEEFEVIDLNDITEVVGDETDSQEFFEKVIQEIEIKKPSYISYFKDYINDVKPQVQSIQSND